MSLKRLAAMLATTVALGTPFAVASPASADSCSSGHACYYYLTNYKSYSFGDSHGITNFKSFHFGNGASLNDNVESVRGSTYALVVLYQNAGFTGIHKAINVDSKLSTLGNFNDIASSSAFFCVGANTC